ncbi:UNVERIFIED_ORG: hypothetical protein J2Y77_001214 [Pseudomonas lini]
MIELKASGTHIEHQVAMAPATYVINPALQPMGLDQASGCIDILLANPDTVTALYPGKHVSPTKKAHLELLGPGPRAVNALEQQRQRIGCVTSVQVSRAMRPTTRQHVMTHAAQQALRMPEHQCDTGAQHGTQARLAASERHVTGLQETFDHPTHFKRPVCGRWKV